MRVRIAALLAGGEGRRLGRIAKESLMPPGGGMALGPALARRLGEAFETVIVVTKNPGLYGGLPVRASGDLRPGFGPLSGLHAALRAATALLTSTPLQAATAAPRSAEAAPSAAGDDADGEAWLWLAACDMPAFDARLVGLLSTRLEPALTSDSPPLACLARRGTHFEPFQALYSTRLLPRLETLLAEAAEARSRDGASREERDPSFKELFAGQAVLYIPEDEVRRVTPDWELFFNINRPEDLEAYRGRTAPPTVD